MTGLEYIGRRDLHPFWDECRDPNREDVADAYEQGKIDGYNEGLDADAVLADEHPDIDVRTMAAWQSGYQAAIDKACEYLEEYTPQKFEDIQNYVENFRKAMNRD